MTNTLSPQALEAKLKRFVKESLSEIGGSGRKMLCRYCGRESFPDLKQPAHYDGCETHYLAEAEQTCRSLRAQLEAEKLKGVEIEDCAENAIHQMTLKVEQAEAERDAARTELAELKAACDTKPSTPS